MIQCGGNCEPVAIVFVAGVQRWEEAVASDDATGVWFWFVLTVGEVVSL